MGSSIRQPHRAPAYRSPICRAAVTVGLSNTPTDHQGGRALLRFVIQFLIPIALAIFAVVDCALTPRPYVRVLPKPLGFLLMLVPYLGALLGISAGRAVTRQVPRGSGRRAPATADTSS